MSYSYLNVVVRHDDCWSKFTSYNYIDTLVNVEYSNFDLLKATRVAIVRGSKIDGKSQIKSALNKDRSIVDFEISHLWSNSKYSFYLISMLQESEKTMINKFKNKNVLIVNSNIKDGKEVYDVIMPRDFKHMISETLKDDNKINVVDFNLDDKIDEARIFRIISRNSISMLLTEKEQLLMKKAREIGYFNTPREKNSQELAEELGVSKMNISLSLRNILKKISNLI
ncbi:helix-turn-helix domain-containing protein [Sulfolobus tengchongensis]|uniref:Helix-turn-helix domain-containing protein n=1 Tax=Sulfolobus tengchongensis TaxID=207809 RepID=A0AAX4L093_9CREN